MNDMAARFPGRRKAVTPPNAFKRDREIPDVWVDDSRDELFMDFARATLDDIYLSPTEKYQDRIANAHRAYADDQAHAQRMYEYSSKGWCIPATPILANGGTTRGLPISCYLTHVQDDMKDIIGHWAEIAHLGHKGGGIGSYWGDVRSADEKIGLIGKSSGVMPFLKVDDAQTASISQGNARRASAVVFLDIDHPEIELFVEMRQKTGGDPKYKCLNLHHGVVITDAFMWAVVINGQWDLKARTTGLVVKTLSARALFEKIIEYRMANGEPFILFLENANKHVPIHHKKAGLLVRTSNLCMEILLPTGRDQYGNHRTAVCALYQLNAEKFDEWKDDPNIIEDVARFMDNVLTDYIDHAGPDFARATYSAQRERSIGVGHFGIHSYLQMKNVPVSSPIGMAMSTKIAKHINDGMKAASYKLAVERGPCPDAADYGIMERFSCKTAMAPTASVSIVAGAGCSAGGDFIPANIYTHKTRVGSWSVKNKWLTKVLDAYGRNTNEVWDSIVKHTGSVAHLDFLSDHERDVFKTAYEIDPKFGILYNEARIPHIDQSQSYNMYIPPMIDRAELMRIHIDGWMRGIKSYYYLRTLAPSRGDSSDGEKIQVVGWTPEEPGKVTYEECTWCQ
jgi:ribonucleoside-diphosphate reductase alpha chain